MVLLYTIGICVFAVFEPVIVYLKYGEDAVKGLNESEDLKSFKFKVYTESSITNGKATRLANTVNTLKEAEDLIQSYRKQNLKAHYKVNED